MKIKGKSVTPAQAEVYAVLKGSNRKGLPDHALVPLTQHVANARMSSSGIRTRRKELVEIGLVEKRADKRQKMPSGRSAAIYRTK